MSDSGNQAPSAAVVSSEGHQTPAKAKKEKKIKNPKSKPSHPPTSEMVTNAIKGLKERGGSSLQAIKKYIAANYKVDAEKVAPFIKKYLKTAVQSGSLVQTKGKGASGSFKLASATASGGKKQTTAADKKKSAGGRPKKPAAKKSTAVAGEKAKSASKKSPKTKKEKKVTGSAATAAKAKKPVGEKKAAAAKPKASPSKAKKTKSGAGAIKKPKAPKPKSAKAVQSKGAKKAASPKKKK